MRVLWTTQHAGEPVPHARLLVSQVELDLLRSNALPGRLWEQCWVMRSDSGRDFTVGMADPLSNQPTLHVPDFGVETIRNLLGSQS